MLTIHNISNPIFWTSNMKIWMKLFSLHYILLLVNQDHLWIWICISLRVIIFLQIFFAIFSLGQITTIFPSKRKQNLHQRGFIIYLILPEISPPQYIVGINSTKYAIFTYWGEEAVLCKMSSIRLKSMFFHGAVAFDLIILIMYIHYFVFFIAHYATL